MARFVEVTHSTWIGAPLASVRAQFADVQHHIDVGVHPRLRFELLEPAGAALRYVQELRLLGLTQRDVFERTFEADGTMTDTSIEGFNRGGSLSASFLPSTQHGASGTTVTLTVRLPLPPVIGVLLRPLLARQVRRELLAAVAEDKYDLEERGYPARPDLAGGFAGARAA